MEELAKMIKVRPNVAKYFVTDPKLAIHLIFYGLVPYQYRLEVNPFLIYLLLFKCLGPSQMAGSTQKHYRI
jgi:hypothetical protein